MTEILDEISADSDNDANDKKPMKFDLRLKRYYKNIKTDKVYQISKS